MTAVQVRISGKTIGGGAVDEFGTAWYIETFELASEVETARLSGSDAIARNTMKSQRAIMEFSSYSPTAGEAERAFDLVRRPFDPREVIPWFYVDRPAPGVDFALRNVRRIGQFQSSRESHRKYRYQVEMESDDWRLFEQLENVVDTGAASSVNITVGGTVETPLHATQATIATPDIRLVTVTPNQRFFASVPIGAGAVIDSASRTIVIGSVSQLPSIPVQSDWVHLQPGLNTLQVTSRFTFRYRAAFV